MWCDLPRWWQQRDESAGGGRARCPLVDPHRPEEVADALNRVLTDEICAAV
jgi:hypothetical protein